FVFSALLPYSPILFPYTTLFGSCRWQTQRTWYDAPRGHTDAAVTDAGDERRAGLSVRGTERVHVLPRRTRAEGHGGLLERGNARDRKSTRLNSVTWPSRMPSSAR